MEDGTQVGYATRVEGGGSFRLAEIDSNEDGGLDESEAEQRLAQLTAELREPQELNFAAETNGILVILQGMDASGKEVTIGNVFAAAACIGSIPVLYEPLSPGQCAEVGTSICVGELLGHASPDQQPSLSRG